MRDGGDLTPATRVLCTLRDIPDGNARGFPPPAGGLTSLIAIRQGMRVFVYVNACPHIGLPLEPSPDRFLDRKRELIVCSAHGARFRIEDGACVSGPCLGDALESVPVTLVGDEVHVPAEAGR